MRGANDQTMANGKIAGTYQVTHVVPMGDLDESEIKLGLGAVAFAADSLGSSVGGDNF